MRFSQSRTRVAKTGCIILSLLIIGCGIDVMVDPLSALTVLDIIAGVLLILFGAMRLIGYFSGDLYRLAYQHDLPLGILLCLSGIAMVCRPAQMIESVFVLLGFIIVTDALFKMQTSLDARRFGLESWWLILVFSILAVISGLVLALRPAASDTAMRIILGSALAADGLLTLTTTVAAVRIVNQKNAEE